MSITVRELLQLPHLRLTLTLPSGAGNTFQGLSSTITYTFNGTQRTATSG